MKIGFISTSITQSIPYITYFISIGYDVYPLILDFNNRLINILDGIVNKNYLISNYTTDLDCLIVIIPQEKIDILKQIDYKNMLKKDAPIILNTDFPLCTNVFPQENFYLFNYNSINIVDNCNNIVESVEKVLQKK